MNGLQMVELKQKHLATGLFPAVIRVNDFGSPVSVDAGDYVLVIASERSTVALDIKTARAWVDAGASYEEALWFAFHCAKSVESDQKLNVVVIIVDSESLETRCHFWLENNND